MHVYAYTAVTILKTLADSGFRAVCPVIIMIKGSLKG
jgi:hypothetical protein